MNNEIAVRSSAAISQISPEQVDILRKTLFKKFTDDEIEFSLAVCKRTGLDPFSRQVHFRKQRSKDGDDSIVIITGIDGFRLIAARSGAYAGSDEPSFEMDGKNPVKATATVYRIVQGQRVPFAASARWIEFYPGDGQGFMWRKMPFTMLGKCAEAQALRKAFPAELVNIYAPEELDQARSERSVVSTKADQVNALLAESPTQEPIQSEQIEDLGEYVIEIGKKHKGMKLKEVSVPTLRDFAVWVDENIENKSDAHLEFLDVVQKYLEQQK